MRGYGRIPPVSPAGARAGTSVLVTAAKPRADGCASQPALGVSARRCHSRGGGEGLSSLLKPGAQWGDPHPAAEGLPLSQPFPRLG